MAARIARLTRRSEFLRASSEGRKWAARGLILQAVATAAKPSSREAADGFAIGYTASRRVGGAVERNRAKRRLRAAVAHVMPTHATPGYDYVVIARPETLLRPFDALLGDLVTALGRLGLDRVRGRGGPGGGSAPARRRASTSEPQSEAVKE